MFPVAALTPRVRILVVCDEVLPSEIEAGVFTLEGVRQQLQVDSFPCVAQLSLFLVLSCPRDGTYQGRILIIDFTGDEERVIRYQQFSATFEQDYEIVPLFVDLGNCHFPAPGQYLFQVWFTALQGGDAQKGELPFYVLENQE